MKQISLSLFLICFFLYAKATNDTIWIDEIKIESSKVPAVYSESARIVTIITKAEIKQAPIQSVADLLEYAMNVDVRQRGFQGVQSDISIRGGSFDQTLILINGIPFNDPQTGHHNADLPIDVRNIEKIEVLEGPASRIFGPNAFSGAINIITSNPGNNKIFFGGSYGEHHLYSGILSGTYTNGNFTNHISLSKRASGGYIQNTDYDILNIHYQANFVWKKNTLDFQTAYQDKGFGANSFYTPAYPNQYEATKTYFISARFRGGNRLKYQLSAYYKKHDDRFELFRNNPASWYTTHNYHQTHVYGFESNLNFTTSLGRTAIGASYRNERIYSNKLGLDMKTPKTVGSEPDIFYTKSDSRDNYSFFVEHAYYSERFSMSIGSMLNYNSVYSWEVFPGTDLSFKLSQNLKLFASLNKSYRIPTFTDLYYVGPTNIGNSDVQPEEAVTIEGGIKILEKNFAIEAAYFNRNGENIIDWVKMNAEDKWQSKNITELQTRGVEFLFITHTGLFKNAGIPINKLRLSYSFIDVKKSSGDLISKYALDYLKHKLSLSIAHNIFNNLSLSWMFSYQDRAGTYQDYTLSAEKEYDPFFIIDIRLNWQIKNWDVYLDATNLLNESYFDIGNVVMPGRWVRLGFTYNINL